MYKVGKRTVAPYVGLGYYKRGHLGCGVCSRDVHKIWIHSGCLITELPQFFIPTLISIFFSFGKLIFVPFPYVLACFFLFKQFLFRFQTPSTTTHIVAEVSQHNMVAATAAAAAGLVSRTGRHLQRYDIRGRRQVVG